MRAPGGAPASRSGAALCEFDDLFRRTAEEQFFGLRLARFGDLSGDALRLFGGQFARFFFELLFEGFTERLAVVVGEPSDLVELPVAVFFDKIDFERLRAERAAFEFDLRR